MLSREATAIMNVLTPSVVRLECVGVGFQEFVKPTPRILLPCPTHPSRKWLAHAAESLVQRGGGARPPRPLVLAVGLSRIQVKERPRAGCK